MVQIAVIAAVLGVASAQSFQGMMWPQMFGQQGANSDSDDSAAQTATFGSSPFQFNFPDQMSRFQLPQQMPFRGPFEQLQADDENEDAGWPTFAMANAPANPFMQVTPPAEAAEEVQEDAEAAVEEAQDDAEDEASETMDQIGNMWGNMNGMQGWVQPQMPEASAWSMPPQMPASNAFNFQMPENAAQTQPQMPNFEMPNFQMPQQGEQPEGAPVMPNFQVPSIQMPQQGEQPNFQMPNFQMPQQGEQPNFEMPNFQMPQQGEQAESAPAMPNFEMPNFQMPEQFQGQLGYNPFSGEQPSSENSWDQHPMMNQDTMTGMIPSSVIPQVREQPTNFFQNGNDWFKPFNFGF